MEPWIEFKHPSFNLRETPPFKPWRSSEMPKFLKLTD